MEQSPHEENAHISESYEIRNHRAWEFKFSDRIYSETAFFTKLSQVLKTKTLSDKETVELPQQAYTLNENFSERNAFYCTYRYYPSRERLITMLLLAELNHR